MKKLITSTLLAASVLSAQNVTTNDKAHIGVSLSSDTNTITLGYDLEDSLRIEGFFAHSDSDMHDTLMLGAGFFMKNQSSQNSHIYFGGRLAYVDYGFDDGITIAPMFGFEYLLNAHVSIGGEAGYQIGTSDIPNQTVTNATLRYYF